MIDKNLSKVFVNKYYKNYTNAICGDELIIQFDPEIFLLEHLYVMTGKFKSLNQARKNNMSGKIPNIFLDWLGKKSDNTYVINPKGFSSEEESLNTLIDIWLVEDIVEIFDHVA